MGCSVCKTWLLDCVTEMPTPVGERSVHHRSRLAYSRYIDSVDLYIRAGWKATMTMDDAFYNARHCYRFGSAQTFGL